MTPSDRRKMKLDPDGPLWTWDEVAALYSYRNPDDPLNGKQAWRVFRDAHEKILDAAEAGEADVLALEAMA